MDIDALLSRVVRDARPPSYPVATADALRMDGNTNLMGANPSVRAALAAGADRDANHYPSGLQDELRTAIAAHHGLSIQQTLVGAGSDELIDLVIRTFIDPGETIAFPVPTFVMYGFYARLARATIVEIPCTSRFDWEIDGKAKVTFIASPNNPTGNAMPPARLERIIRGSRGIVVIDEAYAEFCGQDFIRRLAEFENLVVCRTFSKAYGLAGLRVGYVCASKTIIDRMIRVKVPFTVSLLSERVAVAAIKDPRYVADSRRMIATEKPWLTEKLKSFGWKPYPTDANFILVEAPRSKELVEFLAARNILVRDMSGFAGLDGFFRTTIGRRFDNERLVAAIGEFLK